MGVLPPCPSQEPIVGIVGRVHRPPRVERRSLFQAFRDQVHAESLPSFEEDAVRADAILSLQRVGLQHLDAWFSNTIIREKTGGDQIV